MAKSSALPTKLATDVRNKNGMKIKLLNCQILIVSCIGHVMHVPFTGDDAGKKAGHMLCAPVTGSTHHMLHVPITGAAAQRFGRIQQQNGHVLLIHADPHHLTSH